MASGCSLGWLPFLLDRDKSLVLAEISESRQDLKNYLYINISITFGSSSTSNVTQIILAQSLQNGLRQAENLKVLLYLNKILASLGGSQASLRPFGGSVAENFCHITLRGT